MQNLLTAHPDVRAVFAQNDEMGAGALRAPQTGKSDVMVVGFDGTPDAEKANSKLAATVAQLLEQIMKGVETADMY